MSDALRTAPILSLALASLATAQVRSLPVDQQPTSVEDFEALCEQNYSTKDIETQIALTKANATANVQARLQNLERQLDQSKAALAECMARAPQAAAAVQAVKAKDDAARAERQAERDQVAARAKLRQARRAAATAEAKRTALSAELCALKTLRQEATGEIATDKRYAHIGGAVNLSHRYELQEELRHIDERMSMTKATIAALHLKPTACSDALVGPLSTCVGVGWDPDVGIMVSDEPVSDECGGDNVVSWLDLLDIGAN